MQAYDERDEMTATLYKEKSTRKAIEKEVHTLNVSFFWVERWYGYIHNIISVAQLHTVNPPLIAHTIIHTCICICSVSLLEGMVWTP